MADKDIYGQISSFITFEKYYTSTRVFYPGEGKCIQKIQISTHSHQFINTALIWHFLEKILENPLMRNGKIIIGDLLYGV